jgi:uncharacterized protein (TIGR02265 family)
MAVGYRRLMSTPATGGAVSIRIGETTTVCSDDILVQPFDIDTHVAGIPKNASTRGFFANQMLKYLPDTRPEAQAEYLRLHPEPFPSFREVSIRDMLRRGFDAARLAHPDLPVAEALRRMGRSGYKIVLDSLLGRMIFATVMNDLDVVYRIGARSYDQGQQNGSRLVYTRLGDTHFRYDFDPCFGWLDSYHIGLIEGPALKYGFSTEIQVYLQGPYRGSLECRWF